MDSWALRCTNQKAADFFNHEFNVPLFPHSFSSKGRCSLSNDSSRASHIIPFAQIRVHLQYLGYPIANDFLYLYSGPLPEELRKKAGDTTADAAAARGAAKMAAVATVAGATLAGAIRVVVAAKARKAREDAEGRQGLADSTLQGGLSVEHLAGGALDASLGGRTGKMSNGEAVSNGLPNEESNGRSEGAIVKKGVSTEGGVESGGPSEAGPRPAQVESADAGEEPEALFEVDPYCTTCPSVGPKG